MRIDNARASRQQGLNAKQFRLQAHGFQALQHSQPFNSILYPLSQEIFQIWNLCRPSGNDELADLTMRDPPVGAIPVEQFPAPDAELCLRKKISRRS